MRKRIIPMVVAGLMIVFLLPLVVFADVSYVKKSGTTVDVLGPNGIKTTFNNNGYAIKVQGFDASCVTADPKVINGGSHVQLAYKVTNNTTTAISGKLGVHADVMIGGNDRATIEVIKNKSGQVIGLKMLEGGSNGNQFSLYFRGAGGVTDAKTYWFGHYGQRETNCFNTVSLEKLENTDSGIALSWEVSVPAGESRTYSCIVGVGEAAAPPEWGVNPVNLSMDTTATRENMKLRVTAKVKDASGVTDTLYYSVNGGAGSTLGNTVTGDGSTEKTINGEIDLTGLPDGTYNYQFWIVNSKGMASEAVGCQVVLQGGKVSGNVSLPNCNGNHDWATAWTTDGTNHWHICNKVWCHEITGQEAHDWRLKEITADDREISTCRVCDREKQEPHTHTWTYSSQANVLTAVCGQALCRYHQGVSISLLAEEKMPYDPNGCQASIAAGEQAAWRSAGLTVPTIAYQNEDGSAVSGLPRELGLYRALITQGGKTAQTEFRIVQATVVTPTIDDKEYSGSHQTGTVPFSTLYTVQSNPGGIEVGTYDVILGLTDSVNYKWDEKGGQTTFRIVKATNSWTSAPSIAGWTYGDSPKSPGYTAKYGNDTVQVAYRPASGGDYGAQAPTQAGAYQVRFTVPESDHYTGLETEIDLTIQKRNVTVVSGIVAKEKNYDGTTSAVLDCSGAQFSGQAAGDTLTVTATGTFANGDVGTGKQVVISGLTLDTASQQNYTLNTENSQKVAYTTIHKKPVTAILAVTTKVYDGLTDAEVTAVIHRNDLEGTDSITLGGLTGAFENKNAGKEKSVAVNKAGLTVTGDRQTQYEITIPESATGEITQAPLEVTAKDHTILYGFNGTPDGSGVNYNGFMDDDTEADLSGTLRYAYDYRPTDNVGDYHITPGGLESDNYRITFLPGKLTVKPKPLTHADISAVPEKTAFAFTGSAVEPAVTVTDRGQPMAKNTDYLVTYSGNTPAASPATAALTLTGSGNYTGALTRKFVITDAITLIPALPETAEPDDQDAIDAYEQAKASFDALDDEQKGLLGAETAAAYQEKLNTLFRALTDYKIIKGSGRSWYQDDVVGLAFVANGAYSKFTQVRIDGEALPESEYASWSGSTVITLKPSYLMTLSIGSHKIQVVYTDGATAEEPFKVCPPSIIPRTGDGSHILPIGCILLLSLGGIALMLFRKKNLLYVPKYRK